jgi:hypothetical protein
MLVLLVALAASAYMLIPHAFTKLHSSDIERAVLRYAENPRADGWDYGRPSDAKCLIGAKTSFRGSRIYVCTIVFPDFGETMGCYSLVGDALYAVGGCFGGRHDLGVGNSRLLRRDIANPSQ